MLRKLSENLLQKLGAEPVLVENGYELVEAIRETGSDVKVLGVTAATVAVKA